MDTWLDLHLYRTADLVHEAAAARTRRLIRRGSTDAPRLTTTFR
ncbi:hypothetical protein [Georgenia sp. SUBG003]